MHTYGVQDSDYDMWAHTFLFSPTRQCGAVPCTSTSAAKQLRQIYNASWWHTVLDCAASGDGPRGYRVTSDLNVAEAPGTCCLMGWHVSSLAASDGWTVCYTLMPISGSFRLWES